VRCTQGVEDEDFLSATALFSMIFGSELFEDIVGELRLASQAAGMMKMEEEGGADMDAEACARRFHLGCGPF
jgi:hypothetical protein